VLGQPNVIEVPTLGKDAVEGLYAAALFEISIRRYRPRQGERVGSKGHPEA
jgi:hypothetical protein